MTALAIFGGSVLIAASIAGSVIAHALLRNRTPEPAPERQTFDEHSAAAMALLAPDDPGLPDGEVAHIAAVIADAVDHYASYLIAVRDGLDPQTCELLREQMYDHLREELTPPQMARALLIGVLPHARDRAAHLTDTSRLSIADLES